MSLFIAALMLSATPEAPPEPALVKGPISMKPSEIRAYNAKLNPDHPNYIRCKEQTITGTLSRRNRVCRTNEDWRRATLVGNEEARTMVDNANRGYSNGEVPAGGP